MKTTTYFTSTGNQFLRWKKKSQRTHCFYFYFVFKKKAKIIKLSEMEKRRKSWLTNNQYENNIPPQHLAHEIIFSEFMNSSKMLITS